MSDRFTKEQVAEAARTALGRKGKAAEDTALFEMYRNFNGSLDQLKTNFAGTPEAAKAKVDGTKFGVTYADPGTLSAEDKRYFDAYQIGSGKGTKLSMASLNYFKQSGTPELLEAQGKGLVTIRESQGAKSFTVSKKGWETYGDKLFEIGTRTNDAILIEKGAATGLADKRLKPYTKVDEKTASKYDVFVKAPRERQGVFGQAAKLAGLSKSVQNSADKAAGYAAWPMGLVAGGGALSDEAAAIGGGTRGAAIYNQVGVNALRSVGLSKSFAKRNFGLATQVGDAATAVGAGIADTVTYGAASAVNAAASALKRSQTGQTVDWVDVGKQMAVSVATTGMLRGLSWGAGKAATAGFAKTAATLKTAGTAWQFGGSQAASTAALGGNSEDVAIAAGRGLVLGALPKDALTQSSASFTLSYADSKRRGYDDEQAVIQASAAAGAAMANSMVARGQYARDVAEGKPDQRTWSGQLQHLKAQVAGVRTAWNQAPGSPAKKAVALNPAALVTPSPLGRGGPNWQQTRLAPAPSPSPYEKYLSAGYVPRVDYVDRTRGVANGSI